MEQDNLHLVATSPLAWHSRLNLYKFYLWKKVIWDKIDYDLYLSKNIAAWATFGI
jgi:hypothetical protein